MWTYEALLSCSGRFARPLCERHQPAGTFDFGSSGVAKAWAFCGHVLWLRNIWGVDHRLSASLDSRIQQEHAFLHGET